MESLFHDHIPPENVHDNDLFISDYGKLIGVTGPKYFHNFLSHLKPPLNFFSHCIENDNIVAI